MTDKTKKTVRTVGLCVAAAGTVAVIIAGGDVKTVGGIVTLTGAAVTAVAAAVAYIFK